MIKNVRMTHEKRFLGGGKRDKIFIIRSLIYKQFVDIFVIYTIYLRQRGQYKSYTIIYNHLLHSLCKNFSN